jgi:DMSO/TMAO reductase YedYZ molybdopterin-dependent catalytic subunit
MTAVEQPTAPGAAHTDAPAGRRPLAALAGILAAAVGLGIGELVAALVGPASSPVVAVGDRVITLTPEPVKDWAIRTFGEQDKLVLVIGIFAVITLFAAGLGLLALRRRGLAAAGFWIFGAVGAYAAATGPAGGVLDGLPALVGGGAGALALSALISPLSPQPGSDQDDEDDADDAETGPAVVDRRRFVSLAGIVLGTAVVSGGTGWLLQRRFDVEEARARLTLPRPASPAAALPPGADLARRVDGLTPLFTRNGDFYRIDTALRVPQIEPADYRLRLTGMFDDPRTYTLDDLFARDDLIERDVTLTCVSNEVGGTLAGNARWLGVPLGALLRENGIQQRSSQLVCRSDDGMTIGAPTRSALEVEDAMLAFGMNGEPLPVEHGFPVRMIIPGLYGYVSACKWLVEIQASTFDAFDAYWVERGWAQEGPIKIASRIDTPTAVASFGPGRRAVAGVAWAQTRGIERVEVQIDEGDWLEADLSPAVDADIWRQWRLVHDFAPGSHLLTVRAIGTDGERQTGDRLPPYPSGATGWHSVRVIVRGQ